MKPYIRFPLSDGTHSRQAHADLPQGTFEREMSKEGFFGPAAHFHHKHPPTAWESFSGSLQPHAYDLNQLPVTDNGPWDATRFMDNRDVRTQHWKMASAMNHLPAIRMVTSCRSSTRATAISTVTGAGSTIGMAITS
jgi:homogentisate 1,2-dioxygenase